MLVLSAVLLVIVIEKNDHRKQAADYDYEHEHEQWKRAASGPLPEDNNIRKVALL